MSETKWTPGPWKMRRESNPEQYAIIWPEQAVRIAELSTMNAANARLISAAPDLAEALDKLLAKVECGSALNCEVCDAARAALRKAKGETT